MIAKEFKGFEEGKYYKAGDLDDFQEALREGSKEKEYTTPEDMVEDYSEKDTDVY